MAHFAKLNENNQVEQVIVVHNNELLDEFGNESEQKGIDFCVNLFGGKWIQTSYNGRIRKNYAGQGYTYDPIEDVFYEPQPFPSWTLDKKFYKWKPPISMPKDNNFYIWNESIINWEIVK